MTAERMPGINHTTLPAIASPPSPASSGTGLNGAVSDARDSVTGAGSAVFDGGGAWVAIAVIVGTGAAVPDAVADGAAVAEAGAEADGLLPSAAPPPAEPPAGGGSSLVPAWPGGTAPGTTAPGRTAPGGGAVIRPGLFGAGSAESGTGGGV